MLHLIKRKLKGYFINNLSIPSMEKSFERIKGLGFEPNCIFEVGAYQGDFARTCLHLWPNANVVCFEPLAAKYEQLNKWSQQEKRVKAIHGLLGDRQKEKVKFNENETASSVLDEHNENGFTTSYQVMRTLDSAIKEFSLPAPQLIKIDTQGYEFQILNGFLENLRHTEVIVAELNHIDIHKDVHLAEEVIQLLYSHGFVIFDITEIHRRPLDNAIWQTDFMFVKKTSPWRQNKKWK